MQEESSAAVHSASGPVSKRWYPNGLKFPCPLDNHKHETVACTQFFGLCPKERFLRIERRKVCWTCMKPKDVCVGPKCTHYKKVPEILLCSGCAEFAETKGWAPMNIVYCKRMEHRGLRAPLEDIKKAWEKYLGKFECKTADPNIKITVNFTYQAHNVSCNRKRTNPGLAPCIDSSSGAKVALIDDMIIPERDEDSFYMMQTLKIGSSTILAFLDSGSNAHLIDESIAEREGLLKTSERPTAISVVGGGNIKSSRSSYQFNLGPGEKGQFYEMNCIGMDAVTTRFQEYNLEKINQEFRAEYGPGSEHLILPKKIGGTKVHLLIGIKNVLLTPVLERVLDSGIAVYISPFTDIYGSNRIYAGPHATFTRGNNGTKTHAVYTFRKELAQIHKQQDENEEDVVKEWRSHSVIMEKSLGLTCHPHPIIDNDVISAGAMITTQLEDRIDDEVYNTIRSCQDGSAGHMCSSYKATIPISRMREILDLDDCDEVSTYRCPECSKCIKCKNSVRRNAILLQESAEQEVIERSVILDKINKKVVVSLPWTKDPVEFLSRKHGGADNYAQAVKVYKS